MILNCQQVSINIRTRMNRVVPLFGLDKGGKVRIDVDVAKAGWPRVPPPAWANIYLAFFNVHQWYDYDLPSFGNGVDPPFPCQAEDTQQCVQLCSLPSVKRYQIWGSPHRRESQIGSVTSSLYGTLNHKYDAAVPAFVVAVAALRQCRCILVARTAAKSTPARCQRDVI